MEQTTEENYVIRQESCPECPSSDAYTLYSDGGTYCFSCGYSTQGSSGERPESMPSNGKSPPIIYSGEYARIPSRNITEETCRKFNVKVQDTANGPVLRFPYYSSAGRVVAYKERDKDKNFKMVGKNEDHQLCGQHLFGGGKAIVITEGELDMLAVWQARPNWPVVSIPTGAKGAKKALQHQLKYLLGFDEIILMFDNDEAGIAAAEECITLFPSDKIFIAPLASYKDASEAIQNRDAEAIRQAVWNKRSYTPKSIIDGRTLFDLVSQPLNGRDADYPYDDLNTVTGGLRLGELCTFTAGSGTGKSTLCGEISQHLVNQGHKVGYIALEESVKRTALRLMTVVANKPLHLNNEIDPDDFRKAFDSSVGSGNVFLRSGFGSICPDQILNDIRFLVKAHDVKWVILDHLSILLSGNETTDERRTIDVVMTKLRSFTEETGIGLILISHLRRNSGDKGHEDGARVSMSQLRGSHSIAQLSDLVIALQRDISAGDDSAELVVLKNRFSGSTGPAGHLKYNSDTGRLSSSLDFGDTNKPTQSPTDYGDF